MVVLKLSNFSASSHDLPFSIFAKSTASEIKIPRSNSYQLEGAQGLCTNFGSPFCCSTQKEKLRSPVPYSFLVTLKKITIYSNKCMVRHFLHSYFPCTLTISNLIYLRVFANLPNLKTFHCFF